MSHHSVEAALEALKEGRLIIVADDKERENEGDLILAAEMATTDSLAFMIRHTSGIICVPMLATRLEELRLPQMVSENTEPWHTAFTVSVDYRPGTTTGISARDRAATILALTRQDSKPSDFTRPGHVFPLRYKEGGVLKRAGHTEAAVDLMKMAGLYPAGVICEIVNDDGSVARGNQLIRFAEMHGLTMISVADIIRYRRQHEKLVVHVSQARLPTPYGEFTAHVYKSILDDIEHLAIVMGELKGKSNLLVRVHSECLTGDVFSSLRCDCGKQLQLAAQKIAEEGEGVIIYLRGHEGRGIGLGHKLRAYTLQDQGRDTVEANEELGLPVDSREYGIGAQILVDLGITTLRLMTNNPAKYGGLAGYDLNIIERVPLIASPTEENIHYLRTKKQKLGHHLNLD